MFQGCVILNRSYKEQSCRKPEFLSAHQTEQAKATPRPKVSVIVPVYNAELRVRKCLQSLQAQTYKDFEVICVNDGSTDKSKEIIQEVCNQDARFTGVSLSTNMGVSAARNRGIELASGQYLMFVDADDTLPNTALQHLHQSVVVYAADTVCGIYERVDGLSTYINARSQHLANKAQKISPDDEDLIHSWTLCNKWLSNDIVKTHELRFEPYRHLEDAVFLYTYLRHAKAIYSCPHVVYTYYKPLAFEGRTTTQQANDSLVISARKAFNRICELTESYGAGFLNELRYRYINSPLLGDYYRRIWRLSDNVASEVAEEINTFFALLDDEHKAKLLQNNFDVMSSMGVYSKKQLEQAPLITIIIEPSVSQECIPLILSELYDQPCISFCVRMASAFKSVVSAEYVDMPNLAFEERGAKDIARDVSTEYIAVLDGDVIYDHRSLMTMLKALHKNKDLDYVYLKKKYKAPQKNKVLSFIKYYLKARRCSMANCLFKTTSFKQLNQKNLSGKALEKPPVLVVNSAAGLITDCNKTASLVSLGVPGTAEQKRIAGRALKKCFNAGLHRLKFR